MPTYYVICICTRDVGLVKSKDTHEVFLITVHFMKFITSTAIPIPITATSVCFDELEHISVFFYFLSAVFFRLCRKVMYNNSIE